ncbi:MAG: aminotransferase class III-fold pyridoxal phosphate-dependent enzyme [Bifidobacteriaceae bacterium]|jgi:taurine--2-oxoglutarate transaminase|nr:aminotransferase class III-fold pyridoxal phosphate-dependent enzyme [Bifidobacteriaceae bacterium]
MTAFDQLSGANLDAAVAAASRSRILAPWSVQGHLPGITITGGRGAELWDHEGRRWLDFTSQLVNANLGYQHPALVAAITEQAATLTTISPATANLARVRAAEAIVRHTPAELDMVFFTNGGADAVENAIRLARLATGRANVLSLYRSYHGNTGAAIVATGDWRRIPNEFAWGHRHVFGPYLYRSEFWATTEAEESERALRHLDHTIQAEGPDSIAAILMETIPGTAGVLVPPPGYLAGVRQIADRYGTLLILDEVMAGFARAGAWFALDLWDVTPDLMTFSKGVNSGYVPAGGVAISRPIAESFAERVFPGGLTYAGHPLAMAAIRANIEAMEADDVVAGAARLGTEILGPGLRQIAATCPLVGEVRGLGAFWAVELVSDRTTREPAGPATMAKIAARARERGLLILTVASRIHVAPPCIITPDEARRGLAILAGVLDEVGREG